MTLHDVFALLPNVIAGLIPVIFATAAVQRVPRKSPFRQANRAAMLTLPLALVASALFAWVPRQTAQEAAAWPAAGAIARNIHLDSSACAMLVLVCLLSVVVVRYSRTYLDGEPELDRYCRSLLVLLASVAVLVICNNLSVITLAWLVTSLSLHQLLTFYPRRTQALIAAHKKFLLSRVADVSLLGSLALIRNGIGTLRVDQINAWAAAHPSLSTSVHWATVLLVIAVILKAAQLPFHGWMTQVMEAPTPVSALLHAGVVNIGGFVLIRLAPLMMHAHLARALLVVVGLATAIAASLVMTTRVSVKVGLAWSTIAQMGLMLVQCGLGAWHLALLHLLAHSLYKAYAFLSAGTAVETWQRSSMVARPRKNTGRTVITAVVLLAATAATWMASTRVVRGPSDPSLLPLGLVFGLCLAPMIARGLGGGARAAATTLLTAASLTTAYFAWHAMFRWLLTSPIGRPASTVEWSIVGGGLASLFVVQLLLEARPDSRFARWLKPQLFAGFYLDEWFTRLTFRLWPPQTVGAQRSINSLSAAPAHPDGLG